MGTKRVRKAIVSAVAGLCVIAAPMLADSVLSLDERGQLLAAVVTAAVGVWGVYKVPNAAE